MIKVRTSRKVKGKNKKSKEGSEIEIE
jgi:hypothetical protein